MKDKIQIEGIVHIYDFDKSEEAKIKERLNMGDTIRNVCKDVQHTKYTKHNLVLDAGINQIANTFLTSGTLKPITHIAIGNVGDTIQETDTKLYAETLRFPITNSYIDIQTGISVFAELYVGTQEANGTWAELGLVRGGTAALNSGTLFSKIGVNIEKTNQAAKTILWEIRLKIKEEY